VKTVDHATIIAASPGTVWAILMDVDRYDEWNPFLQLRRPLPRWREFERHDPTRQAPDDVSPHRARFEPGRRITWLGRVLIPGLFETAPRASCRAKRSAVSWSA